jgi:small-conductance mechanosensitive channel
MQALREALERSARATLLAEEHTVKALSDLQGERIRVRELEKEMRLLSERLTNVMSENRRLRNLVGQACQDRSSLSTELRALLQELRDGMPEDPGVAAKPQRHQAA